MNGRQYSSLRRVYHGRYWSCQPTWKLICERNSRRIRAARVPPFSQSALHRFVIATRKLKSAETCLHLRRPAPSSGTPRSSCTRLESPSLWHEARCFRALRNSFARAARAYSRFLKAVSIRATQSRRDSPQNKVNSEFSAFWSMKLELLVILSLFLIT